MRRIVPLCFLFVLLFSATCWGRTHNKKDISPREIWTTLLYRMAEPVLRPMSEGQLQATMTLESGNLEVSPTWDGRDKKVAYMEAFARLMAGLAPWLSLPDDDTAEGLQRQQLKAWALKAYAHAVDPQSPDYLGWRSGGQTLVDAAYLVESFHRGWEALWEPLDMQTKLRYIKEIQGLHRYEPPYQNWLLFCGMEECFLMRAQASLKKAGVDLEAEGFELPLYDGFRIKMAVNKAEEWYVGDGWYADGPAFAFDYYNAYVIHPMYAECLEMICEVQPNNAYMVRSLEASTYKQQGPTVRLDNVRTRMQKFACISERLISPEASYPVFGRSIPYRLAVFQPLAMLAWQKRLPNELSEGQVRSALTAVMTRMYAADLYALGLLKEKPSTPTNFGRGGFLTIGFVGSNPDVADVYTNNGSLYMTSLAFLPLGLPATDSFWTAPDAPWTSLKAWRGDNFPKDHKWRINKQILYWE